MNYLVTEELSKVWLRCGTQVDDGRPWVQHFVAIGRVLWVLGVQCQPTDTHQTLLLVLVKVRRCFREPDMVPIVVVNRLSSDNYANMLIVNK